MPTRQYLALEDVRDPIPDGLLGAAFVENPEVLRRLLEVATLDRRFMLPLLQQLGHMSVARAERGRLPHRSNRDLGFSTLVRHPPEQHQGVTEPGIDLDGALQRRQRRRGPSSPVFRRSEAEVQHRVARPLPERLLEQLRGAVALAPVQRRPGLRRDDLARRHAVQPGGYRQRREGHDRREEQHSFIARTVGHRGEFGKTRTSEISPKAHCLQGFGRTPTHEVNRPTPVM